MLFEIAASAGSLKLYLATRSLKSLKLDERTKDLVLVAKQINLSASSMSRD